MVRPSVRGDELIEKMLAAPGSSQEVANDLLIEFTRGYYPVAALAPLLSHPSEDVTEVGAWLASEMPSRLGDLLGPAASLVRHVRPAVRFFALDVVLDNVTESGECLAAALALINDVHDGVRLKAMRFAALADESQLRAAEPFLSKHDGAALTASGLLVDDGGEEIEPRVKAGLASEDNALRRWAAAAAARLGSEALLEVGTRSDDEDVSTFTARELSRLRRFGRLRDDRR